jgi:hypothetical protein
MFDGVVGAWGVGKAGGLSSFAAGVACEACPLAAFFLTCSTLDLGHLCLLAVLRELNFCPYATHCRSWGGGGGGGGLFGRFRSFLVPFLLSSTAPLPCKTPLLLLGIIGLAATLLEFEEGLLS